MKLMKQLNLKRWPVPWLFLPLFLSGAAGAWAAHVVAEDPGLERRLSEMERQAEFKPPRPLPKEEIPYYWPYPDVPPPKLAEAHPDAKPQPGWTPRQYFDHLCKLEAGDFIYRPVRAEGYYVIRPYFQLHPSDWLMRDREAVEDPVIAQYSFGFDYRSSGMAGNPEDVAAGRSFLFREFPWLDAKDIPHYALYYEIDSYHGWQYYPKNLAMETFGVIRVRGIQVERKGTSGRFVRFSRSSEKQEVEFESVFGNKRKEWHYPRLDERTDTLKSRYGIFWRGISRPQDREMGIGGGEVYVVDLKTNEVLGMQRHFVMGLSVPSGRLNGQDANIFWRTNIVCPGFADPRWADTVVLRFLNKALIPFNAPSK